MSENRDSLTEHTGAGPDNLSSISSKAREMGRPSGLGRVRKKLKRARGWFSRLLEKRGEECRNLSEPEYVGRRFRRCPIEKDRRFGSTRKPWYCNYCKLYDDPDPITTRMR